MSRTTYTDALTGAAIALQGGTCSCAPGAQAARVRTNTLFFPGCSFMNNAQDIMDRVFSDLREYDASCGITLLCCGKILEFEADGARLRENFERALVERCIEKRVRRIIAACPNCVHELRTAFARYHSEYAVEIAPLPQALAENGKRVRANAAAQLVHAEISQGENPLNTASPAPYAGAKTASPQDAANAAAASPENTVQPAQRTQHEAPLRVAVHDSCPDRSLGEFAQATRALFAPDMLAETAHNRKNSLCCGSLANAAGNYNAGDRLAHLHGEEGVQAGAAALVTSCMSCAHQLSVLQDTLPVFHYFELLYETRIPWRAMPATTQTRFLFESLKGTRTFIGADA